MHYTPQCLGLQNTFSTHLYETCSIACTRLSTQACWSFGFLKVKIKRTRCHCMGFKSHVSWLVLAHLALNGDIHHCYCFTDLLYCSPPFDQFKGWRSWRPVGCVSPPLNQPWFQLAGLLHLPGPAESWRPLSNSELGPPCSGSPLLLD